MFLLGFRRKLTALAYASRLSLLYSGFRYTIELPLQPYKIQLYTFWVQGLAFFHLGSLTNIKLKGKKWGTTCKEIG